MLRSNLATLGDVVFVQEVRRRLEALGLASVHLPRYDSQWAALPTVSPMRWRTAYGRICAACSDNKKYLLDVLCSGP